MSGVGLYSNSYRSVTTSIVLSVLAALVLWFVQSMFKITSFWMFLIYVIVIFALLYFVMPKL